MYAPPQHTQLTWFYTLEHEQEIQPISYPAWPILASLPHIASGGAPEETELPGRPLKGCSDLTG